MLLHRLTSEDVNLPHMANALDEVGNLAERESSSIATIPDDCYEGAVVRAERNLGQCR